jgi:hypothetical protein
MTTTASTDPIAAAMPLFHALTVPVFTRYLTQLAGLVAAAQAHARRQGLPEAALLDARLAPDMMAFGAQVATAAQFALRTSCPLAGRPVPAWPGVPDGLDALAAQVMHARQAVEAMPPAEFDGAERLTLHERAGAAPVSLPALAFVTTFALPNFFFHLSSAYAILRQQGVPIGKGDFDGWHVYPRSHGT